MKRVVLVLPFVPWDENKNGVNKIVYNLIKHSKNTCYNLLVVDKDTGGAIPSELISNINSITFINNANKGGVFNKIIALFREGTYEEQLNSNIKAEVEKWLLREVTASPVDYIHYVTSKFININSSALPKSRQLVSLIDNKELYYKRKLEDSIGIIKLYSFYQLQKIRRVYDNADVEKKYHFVSKVDSELFMRKSSASVITIENGVEIPKFEEEVVSSKVFFHGNFSYEPNIVAFNYFSRIACDSRLSNVKFVVFGRGSDRLKKIRGSNVDILGEVEDVYEALEYGSLYLSPLTIGSGIKNKVLEAMAAGMTVLGTDVSFDGVDLNKEFRRIISVSDIDATIECVLDIISDIAYRKNNADYVKQYVVDNFSWSQKISLYEKLYEND